MSPTALPEPIVDVEWLANNLDQVRVVDVRSYMDGRSGRDAYTAGHIAGAVFASLDDDLSAPVGATGGRHPLPDPSAFAAVMARLGVSDDTAVVAYDDAGGTIAARLWWMLNALERSVAVLDGGLPAWTDAGHALTPESATPKPASPAPASFTAQPWPEHLIISADDVADRIGTPTTILDARSHGRFLGEAFPVDPRYGHVPGARSAPATANIDPDTGRFESIEQARHRYESVGALSGDEVVAYCGSGVTACTDLLQLQRLGVAGRLYVGSWSDWGADHDRPLETGE